MYTDYLSFKIFQKLIIILVHAYSSLKIFYQFQNMLYVSLQNIVVMVQNSQKTMLDGAVRILALARLKPVLVLGKALQLRWNYIANCNGNPWRKKTQTCQVLINYSMLKQSWRQNCRINQKLRITKSILPIRYKYFFSSFFEVFVCCMYEILYGWSYKKMIP